MCSPLRHILDNIFVCLVEESLVLGSNKPDAYFRYVNDIFCFFNIENEADFFFIRSLIIFIQSLSLHWTRKLILHFFS